MGYCYDTKVKHSEEVILSEEEFIHLKEEVINTLRF